MKKVIFPLVCAVLMIFVINKVNPALENASYVVAFGLGILIGSIINKFVFKKEDEEKSEKSSVAK